MASAPAKSKRGGRPPLAPENGRPIRAQRIVYGGIAAALVFSALALHWALRGYLSADMRLAFIPWMHRLQTQGLAADFVYPPPFLYLTYPVSGFSPKGIVVGLKAIALVCDLVMAAGMVAVTRHLHQRSGWFLPASIGILTLFLPSVFIDSAMWGQFDSLYVAPMIWSLWALLKNRPILAWAMLGVGVSFKLQIMFFLPVLFTWWLCTLVAGLEKDRRINWRNALAPAVTVLVFLAALIPARLAGRSWESLLKIYLDQADMVNYLAMNFANLWSFFTDDNFIMLKHAGLILGAVASIAIVGIGFHLQIRPGLTREQTDRTWIVLATICTLVLPYVLPLMHDRYYVAGSAMIVLMATFTRPVIALGATAAQMINLFLMVNYLEKRYNFPTTQLSVVMLLVIVAVCAEAHRTTRMPAPSP